MILKYYFYNQRIYYFWERAFIDDKIGGNEYGNACGNEY